jgi:hypothetical protein
MPLGVSSILFRAVRALAFRNGLGVILFRRLSRVTITKEEILSTFSIYDGHPASLCQTVTDVRDLAGRPIMSIVIQYKIDRYYKINSFNYYIDFFFFQNSIHCFRRFTNSFLV